MVSRNIYILTLFIGFVIILSPFAATIDASLPISGNNRYHSSSIDIRGLLPDPDFDNPPLVKWRGDSLEFTSAHVAATHAGSLSYIELTWTHNANTPLDFRIMPDENLPYCYDFIYCEQSFVWDIEELPDDAEIRLNYSISTTGDFADAEAGGLMFRVYIWLIDSSGNWKRVHRTFPPYSDTIHEIRVDLSYFDLIEGWGGMIEDSSGVQEDPSDELTLAIGLAPTANFESFLGDEPWRNYNGVVRLRVDSANVYTIMDVEPEQDEMLTPIINQTWGGHVQDTFPEVPETYENASDECTGMVISDDGFVYVLVNSKTDYMMYAEFGLYYQYQTLLKFDSQLNLIWARNHNNRTSGLDVCVHDGFIYTAGTDLLGDDYDLLVTKWSPDGTIVWETTWDTGIDEQGGAIDVANDGSIYVYATRDNWMQSAPPYIVESVLLKLDMDGFVEWNKTVSQIGWPEMTGVVTVSDGIYTFDWGYLTFRDLLGAERWTEICDMFSVDRSENLYTAKGITHENGRLIQFDKSDIEGELLWSTNFSISYSGGWEEYLACVSMSIAPDGSVIALIGTTKLSLDYYILKLSTDGAYEWHKIVGSANWVQLYLHSGYISVAPDGIAYIASNLYSQDVGIQSYDVGVSSFNFPIEVALVLVAGLGIVVVSIVFVKKRPRKDYYSEYKERYDL